MDRSYSKIFKEIKLIGKGSFGEVFIVKNKNNEFFVSKKINTNSLTNEQKHSSILEVNLLKHLKHPNIVEYIDSFIEDGYLYIVMEYCEEGDLTNYINKSKSENKKIPESQVISWFVQISLALNFIHNNKILHRDLKCSNIFINKNGIIKIGDFGISKILNATLENAQTVIGTPYYMSPEVCENKPYSFKSDVWSLGCIVYELCNFERPFNANNLIGLAFKIIKDDYEEITDFYSNDLRNIIKKMLCKDKFERPSIYEILNDDYMLKFVSMYINDLKNTFSNKFTNTNKLRIKNILEDEKKKNNLNKVIKESFQKNELREKIGSKNLDQVNQNYDYNSNSIKEETYKGNQNFIVNNNNEDDSDDSDICIDNKNNTNNFNLKTQNSEEIDDIDDIEEYNSDEEDLEITNENLTNNLNNFLPKPTETTDTQVEEVPQKKLKIQKLKDEILKKFSNSQYNKILDIIENEINKNYSNDYMINLINKKLFIKIDENIWQSFENIMFLSY